MCEVIGILLLSGFGGQINVVIPEWLFEFYILHPLHGLPLGDLWIFTKVSN
jgi:hypothetical protein